MTYLRKSLDLPYRPEDLFELVSDVGRYPDFIKWIKTLRLLEDSESDGRWRGRAEAVVGFMSFTETFVTDIDARRDALSVDVALVRGPFRRLKNSWRFTAIPGGSRVDFMIDFVFRNFVLQTLADANRDYAVARIIDSFVDEAGRRYAKVA